jgi:hypothetical protein
MTRLHFAISDCLIIFPRVCVDQCESRRNNTRRRRLPLLNEKLLFILEREAWCKRGRDFGARRRVLCSECNFGAQPRDKELLRVEKTLGANLLILQMQNKWKNIHTPLLWTCYFTVHFATLIMLATRVCVTLVLRFGGGLFCSWVIMLSL